MAAQSEPGAPGSSLAVEPPPAYAEKSPQGPTGTLPATAPTQPPYAPFPQQIQPQYVQQPQQQIPYMMPTSYPAVMAAPKPNHPSPHNFLIYVVIVATVCGFLNPISLALSIPAMVCVVLSIGRKSAGQYPAAATMSTTAFVLANLAVVFTVLLWILIVGLILGFVKVGECQFIQYNSDSGYRRCSTSYYSYYY